MPDAQALDAVHELFAHGLRAADDDEAAVEEILGLELAQVDGGARIVMQRLHHPVVIEAAWDRLIVRRRIEQLVEEILGVLGVEVLGLGIGLADANELQETEPVGIVVAPLARDQLPIAVAHRLGVLGAVIAQMAEAMVQADDIFRGRGDAGAGNPDRRMRLLDRPRPEVHHAELIMLAVPGEDLLRRPGLGHQRQRLAVALALFDRDDGVRDRRVRRQPRGEAGNQPPAADAVEHRVFLGDARRRRGRGQRRAELDDRDVLAVGLPRQHRAHDARIGHEAIDVLVMLVGAQPVQAGLRGMEHLVQRRVVVLADLVGIGDVEPDGIDIGRVVPLLEIGRQVPIGHQVEHADFHGSTSSSAMFGWDATPRSAAAQSSLRIVAAADDCAHARAVPNSGVARAVRASVSSADDEGGDRREHPALPLVK